MKIELFMILSVEINPYLALGLVVAMICFYAIKRGYDHSKLELSARVQMGRLI